MKCIKRLIALLLLTLALTSCAGINPYTGAYDPAYDFTQRTYSSTIKYPDGGSTTCTTTFIGNHSTITCRDYKR
jgi:hypothetical protein